MVQKQDSHYDSFVSYAEELHEKNRKRVKASGILMIVLPVFLGLIRWMTDSDKIVFLIIWVVIMFALSAYLISIEYLDNSIESTLQEVTDTEAEFDGLLPRPDLQDRIRERLAEKRAERQSEKQSSPESEEKPEAGGKEDAE